jgi:hypothetical protein
MIKELKIFIGKNKRITLPKEFEVEEGIYLNAFIDTFSNLHIISNKPKRKNSVILYGIPIGYSEKYRRWYGIIVDLEGNKYSNIRSTTLPYLEKDLVNLDEYTINKLDDRLGKENWKTPILINIFDLHDNGTLYQIIKKYYEGLKAGQWPR